MVIAQVVICGALLSVSIGIVLAKEALMAFLDHLAFRQILWVVPILFALHNLEEASLMEKWSKKSSLLFHVTVSTPQFAIAVAVLTVLVFAATWLGRLGPKQSVGMYVTTGVQAIIFINVIFPHIAVTVRSRSYNPGLLTAVIFNLPFSVYLYQRAVAEGYITTLGVIVTLAIAPFAMIVLIASSLRLGEIICRHLQRTNAGQV